MLTETDWMVRLNDSGLTLLDSRISAFSVPSLGTGNTFSDLDTLQGDALGACARDVGKLDDDEGWLCLLYSPCLGHSGDNSVVAELNCKGLVKGRYCGWTMPTHVL